MSHDELVGRAARWLKTRFGCGVVATELRCQSSEEPDAIGFRYGGTWSVLVEVKVSRSDFLADRKKQRHHVRGMGQERWYLTPPGLVRPEELPDGWGLAEADKVIRVVKHPTRSHLLRNEVTDAEVCFRDAPVLYSLAWRHLNPTALDRSARGVSAEAAAISHGQDQGRMQEEA